MSAKIDNNNDEEEIRKKLLAYKVHVAKEAAANRKVDPLKNWTRPPRDECPICLLPLPVRSDDIVHRSCCNSKICKGCINEHAKVLAKGGAFRMPAMFEALKVLSSCPLCRSQPFKEELTGKDEDMRRLQKKLAKAGSHEAMYAIGLDYYNGEKGKVDKVEGFKWIERASNAGNAKVSHFLADFYREGNGVDKDIAQAIKLFQTATEGGSVLAFAAMGDMFYEMGDIENAMLSYRKAAICGLDDEDLFKEIRDGFRAGFITKEEYAFTLREHQKVSNEMKSASRTEARRLFG